jgi:two-component system, OmpR family, sensor kinase
MSATAWLRRHSVETWWVLFACANVAAMVAWPSWETIPFHFVWISLTLVYGFRVWSKPVTTAILGAVAVATGASIMADAFAGIQLWGELFEVPLMSAMFLAMVWHARRRQDAVAAAEALVLQRERFLSDVSHELRTPLTIARGHIDLLRRDADGSPELDVVVDELARMERIIARLLLLAHSSEPERLGFAQIEADTLLEDVFMRWADFAPRGWKLGHLVSGTVTADEEALRAALDALLENAVKYTEPHDTIELRSRVLDHGYAIDIVDSGCGIAPEALDRIFDRFARGDDARTRTTGGVGLGLSIVHAVATSHGGSCTVTPQRRGTMFTFRLPDFRPSPRPVAATASAPAGSAG